MTSNSSQGQSGEENAQATLVFKIGTAHQGRITRLKLNQFRHVVPDTELRFHEGINVLLGRNGTGKTTLLELICAVASGDLRAYQDESFNIEFDLCFGDEHITILAQNTPSPPKDFDWPNQR